MKITNHSNQNLNDLENLVTKFYPYAKESLGFDTDVSLQFQSDEENASNPLGKTAFYAPEEQTIVVFVDNRHPKDILRSISHELVHHSQNCRGEFETDIQMQDGYAQSDPHLREMEREAYEKGNMTFRDWTDTLDESLKRKIVPMLTESQVRQVIRNTINKINENCCCDSAGKHELERDDKKMDSGALTPVMEVSIDTIVEPKDAIRLNKIKPFVKINGKTFKWEESNGIALRVIDEKGKMQIFKLSDIEDIKKPQIEEPIEEWYRNSLYKTLTSKFSR